MRLSRDTVLRLASRQDSVVTSGQLERLGADRSWIGRQVRSGRWQRVHHGVLVVHGGPLTWRTRARAALLYAGPGSALSHRSAAYVHEIVSRPPRSIEVVVPHVRRVVPSTGLVIRRRRQMPRRIGDLAVVNRGDTVVDLLSQVRTTDEAVALLCAAVRARTSPTEILSAAQARRRLAHRRLLEDLLAEVSHGIESPLEHRYAHDVERRHGLPTARLQVRDVIDGRWIRADRVYEGLGVRAELDGEVAHPGGRTDSDVWRDNAVAITQDQLTLRYRWRHVAGTPCTTAAQVAAALTSRGWSAQPHPCSPTCPVTTTPR